ncbi:hypothetical protein BLJAPNOD_02361 [Ensifer sp. M14]|nr:hypothetical protein BLJAPNOD_02361 [Ensifer sp. M14]
MTQAASCSILRGAPSRLDTSREGGRMSKLIPVSLPENWQELSKEEQTKFLVSRLEKKSGAGTVVPLLTPEPDSHN